MFYPNGYNAEGAGENIVWSAADFENFLEPRPDMPAQMESELEPVLRLLVKQRWPFRIHATYGESIERDLAVIEKVNRELPFNGLRWFFDHAETITDAQLVRVKKLGGGVAVQNRLHFQGEHYWKRYGAQTRQLPPIRKMLEMKIPVGLGTDGTRVSSYGPWPAIYWAVSGKTAGGMPMWQARDRLTRYEALKLMTQGSAWFSGEEQLKGRLAQGQYADLVILPKDYFSIPEAQIKTLDSALTVVNGRIVHASPDFGQYAPELPPVQPEWSPVKHYGGYQNR
jgi:predicted amidohydrolase YtcJ